MLHRIEALERLQKLREAGVIDEHEFETQKKSVFSDNGHSQPSVDTEDVDSDDHRVILTDEDVSIDNALRGRRWFCAFFSSMIHGYRGSKYFGRRDNV